MLMDVDVENVIVNAHLMFGILILLLLVEGVVLQVNHVKQEPVTLVLNVVTQVDV